MVYQHYLFMVMLVVLNKLDLQLPVVQKCNYTDGKFKEKYPHARNIDFFTADFNEELSAFKGLRDQVEYVTQAISFIVDLYPQNPNRNIILIGHSMGGLVARIAASRQQHESNVDIILTLATPHSDPFPWLPKTSDFPDEVGLISIYLLVDLMVPPLVVTPKSKSDHFFSVDAAKLLGVPIDHQGIVWCGQLREKLSEALIGISGLNTLQDRMKVFKKYFLEIEKNWVQHQYLDQQN